MAKPIIDSYESAAEFLGPRDQRDTGQRGTRLIRQSDGSIAVMYHLTKVVTYHEDGTATVNNGGYVTPTTSRRINQFLPEPYRAYVRGGVMRLARSPESQGFDLPVKVTL